jgi:hypothetical protein
MKLINSTSYCSEKLKEIIKWCMPDGVFLKDIRKIDFGNTKLNWHGRAWGSMRVHIGVPRYGKYLRPYNTGGRRGYLNVETYSWEEGLIELIAHELRHLYQYKKNKFFHGIKKIRKYNMGTRAKLCEVDASLYAKRKVREYRKSNFKLNLV